MKKVFISLAMIMLLSNCEAPTNLAGSQLRRIQVGVTTKAQLTEMFGPPQIDNSTEASWSVDSNTNPGLAMAVANHFLELNGSRTLIVEFSSSDIVTSCQMDVMGKISTDEKRYYCSEVPGL